MSELQSHPESSSVFPYAASVQIPALNLEHRLQKLVQYDGILRGVCHKLKTETHDLHSFKLSLELNKLVANSVEAIIVKGNRYDIDKQQLVVEILVQILSLSPEDQYQINQQKSFLFDNGQIK